MAGSYPDPPSWRMAWDRDGSQLFRIDGGSTAVQMDDAFMKGMNSELGANVSIGAWGGTTATYCIIFPELRDIDAYYAAWAVPTSGNGLTLSVSSDTTNGVDGTWAVVSGATYDKTAIRPGYRSNVSSTTVLGIKAVKFAYTRGTSSSSYTVPAVFHMFGEPVPEASTDRLELWDPTNDSKLGPAALDFGNSPRGGSELKSFRVKNLSASLTAPSVRVAMEVLTDSVPSIIGQHQLSVDGGGSWLPQVNVGDLSPGEISVPIAIRETLVVDAELGAWAFRVFAESTGVWV